jgi:integrase
LIICDKELTLDQKKEARQSLKFAIDQAKKAVKSKDEQGFFSATPPAEKVFREALKGSNQISFKDVLKYKRNEVAARTFSNLEITISNWKKIIGSSRLDSVTTVTLNRFARELKRPKKSGGRGFTTNAANDSAVRIRSLIRTHNVNISDESERIDWPSFDPIQKTTAERKAHKIKERAITVEDAIKVLGYAKEKDEYAWRALLILSNTTFRASEVCALRWKNVKDADEIIYFDLTDSKTVEGLRRLPLNSRLRKHLLPLRGADDEFIINNSWPTWNRPRDGLGHFLTTAKKHLKIEGRTNPHAFRHAAGGDLGYYLPEHIKKKLMGHAGGLTDHYTREDMKVLADAVEFIGAGLDCL